MKNFANDASSPSQLKDSKEPGSRGLQLYKDPNNAPPTEATSMMSPIGGNPLLFDSLSLSSDQKTGNVRHSRTRTETFSHSRPFALTNDVPLAQTTSVGNPAQRRSTLSGLEISMNRTTSLDINTKGLLDAFGPTLFTAGWDNFTPSNQSPLSGLISPNVAAIQAAAPAPASAVETVVSAIDFLDMDGPSSFQFMEDPFNTFPSGIMSSDTSRPPTAQSRLRSYSSAFVPPHKPMITTRHRSISIPEKEMKAEFRDLDLSTRETTGESGSKSPSAETSPNSESSPTRSLWVGNLDSSIPQNEILSLFVPFGPIDSLRMIPERECAFINFLFVEDASKAKSALNGTHLGNCIIKVAYGKADLSVDAISTHSSKSLWIGNIPATLEPADLEKIFGYYGPIESARVLSHKNCGFINFVHLEDAVEARKHMNGKEISGAIVKIGFAKVPNSSVSTPGIEPLSNEWVADMNSVMMNKSLSATGWPSLLKSSTAPNMEIQTPSFGNSNYASSIPGLPLSDSCLDNNVMRDFRKRLESTTITSEQVTEIFNSVIYDATSVSSDYIGNVVIQKIIEKGTDDQRLQIIRRIAPYMASIGIHKNGTWAIQKILDTVKLPAQIQEIVEAVTPYTPALLLDQYGNYVVQCCLRFGNQNQFIFDAISSNMLKIGLARFGSRATRTCLESQHTNKLQQKLVATSIIKHCFELSCDQNGALLISWLLDTYYEPGKYSEITSVFKRNLVNACTHKIASAVILKICTQKSEPEARETLLNDIFSSKLVSILADPVNGTSLIRKILTNATKDQQSLINQISKLITRSDILKYQNIKRFLDEFSISIVQENVSR